MRSLVLVGHGSHLNPESARAVYRYAELLRERGLYDEVIEAYWKEEPSLRQVLRTVSSTDVTVIPMFISEGYFTETVIPRELGLGHQGPVPRSGVARVIGGRTVRYTLPYGVHPAMTDVILERAREACPDASGADTALVIIGHGTTRNQNSSRVIHDNAHRIEQLGIFKEVRALFLDEDPRLDTWTDVTTAPRVIMVPFFASEGWHTLETIPEDLGLTGPVTSLQGRTVYYAKPTGTHARVAEVITQLAEEARASSPGGGERDQAHADAWRAFTELARQGLRFGEVLITPHADLFEIRHALDEGRHLLETFVTPEGLRDRIRLDERGQHRPVHTFRNLPRGWRAVVDGHGLRRAIHYLYPAVVEETYACNGHALHSTPWPTTTRRQTGIYTKVTGASPELVQRVTREVCGQCLRTPLWAGEKLDQTFLTGVPGAFPCAEACTYLIAEVREAMTQKKTTHHHDHD